VVLPEEQAVESRSTASRHGDEVHLVLPGVRGDCLGDAALKHLGHRLDSPVGSAVRDRLDDLLALAFEYVDNLAVDPCDAVVGRVGDVENVVAP